MQAMALQAKIYELAKSKQQLIDKAVVKEFISEFENLGIRFNDAINRVENAKCINTYSAVKFSDFIQQDTDELVPQSQVFRAAVQLIQSNIDNFKRLAHAYYGDRIITREENTKILEMLTRNELTWSDLQQSKQNLKWIDELQDILNEKRKRFFESKDLFKQELLTEITTVIHFADMQHKDKITLLHSIIYSFSKELKNLL